MIRDYLGKPLKEGDIVIFNNNGYFQKAELLEFYQCIPHNVGRYGLSYDEIRIIDSKLSDDRKYCMGRIIRYKSLWKTNRRNI